MQISTVYAHRHDNRSHKATIFFLLKLNGICVLFPFDKLSFYRDHRYQIQISLFVSLKLIFHLMSDYEMRAHIIRGHRSISMVFSRASLFSIASAQIIISHMRQILCVIH